MVDQPRSDREVVREAIEACVGPLYDYEINGDELADRIVAALGEARAERLTELQAEVQRLPLSLDPDGRTIWCPSPPYFNADEVPLIAALLREEGR